MIQTALNNQQLLTRKWANGKNIVFPDNREIKAGSFSYIPIDPYIYKNCHKCGAEVRRAFNMKARLAVCFDCKEELKREISKKWKEKMSTVFPQ